jgi:hypothetical protein
MESRDHVTVHYYNILCNACLQMHLMGMRKARIVASTIRGGKNQKEECAICPCEMTVARVV